MLLGSESSKQHSLSEERRGKPGGLLCLDVLPMKGPGLFL